MQIVADVLGRPVVASGEAETTSRGVALLALRALGAIPSLDAVPAAEGPTYEPDPVRHAVYQGAIARQAWLYERLISPRPDAVADGGVDPPGRRAPAAAA